ncbi:hypothetical protein CcrColossus_gp432 [Caulobacter phage CcrColossus]|uniref:Uncharacterized protein n=1 Tax=Caulobacter phage CcrColossus TaxID=1211640 RepID=K4K6T3_9CAUD|nr:hypothetical protein CcrColossus_gp432 [Caulobacter phage CcrColossus]AFU88302.1 hypothetical protein CcrColossus_gp432 [Caulobacter phage CcrColossus]
MTFDAYRVRIAIWNNQNSDFEIAYEMVTADNRWAKRPFTLSRRLKPGVMYVARFATFEAACAGAERHRKAQPKPPRVAPTKLQERAKALHDARTLARDLELEAQSASGARWQALRGYPNGPGLIEEAEIAAKQRDLEFMEALVEATGFGRSDLREMIG